MSIKIMQWAWEQDIATSSMKLLLLALADRANDEGVCWQGQTALSKKCSMTKRTLIRSLKALEADNFITIEHRPGDGSGRGTNLYHLNLEGVAKCQFVTRQSDNLSPGKVPKTGGQSANLSPGKVTICHGQSDKNEGQSDNLSPNPLVNTKKSILEEEEEIHESSRACATAEKTSSSSSNRVAPPSAIVGAWIEINADKPTPALTPDRQKRIADVMTFLSQQIGRTDWPCNSDDVRPWFADVFSYAKNHTAYLSARDFDFFLDANRLARVVEGCYESRH